MNRARMPAFPAVVFEAVGAVSETRTIRRDTDAALRITAEVDAPADIQAVIMRPVERRSDTRCAVFAEIKRTADSKQLVVRETARQAKARQTVFAVLIREGHTIQT
ncbi:hypothetical protein ACQ9LF_13690 [Anaerohalosphaeraceae bacterium U12dextr]